MSRPSWEQYALTLAYAARLRSEDPYGQVGAVTLRHDHSTASTGFNGAPPGINIDWSDRSKRRPYVIHAERNACNYIKPGECYLIASTLLPCPDCLKEISIKGIKEVVYSEVYTTDPAVTQQSYDTAKLYGIKLTHIPLDEQAKKFPKFAAAGFSIGRLYASIIKQLRNFLHI